METKGAEKVAGLDAEAAGMVSGVRIKVTLEDVEPAIWRLIELDPELSLDQLHEILQVAVGWREAHLYRFQEQPEPGQDPDLTLGPPRTWLGELSLREGLVGLRAVEMTVGRLLEEVDAPVIYEYDFGDGWEHRLELAGIQRKAATDRRAVVTAGGRSAPPEDCGGPWGYRDLLKGMDADRDLGPDGPDREWADESAGPWRDFDPGHFDTESVNEELAFRFPSGEEAAEMSVEYIGEDETELDVLTGRIAPGWRVELREQVRRQGVREPTEPSPGQAAAILRPYLWLLDRVGEDGIKLTQAGWLPPRVVTDCVHELGWDRFEHGKFNREIETPTVLELRESASNLKLLRKYKGRLKLTRAAVALRELPVELLDHVAAGLVSLQPDDATRDAALLALVELAGGGHERERDWLERIAGGLELLGYRTTNGAPPDIDDVRLPTRDLRHDLERLGAFTAPEGYLHRFIWRPASPEGQIIARLALAD